MRVDSKLMAAAVCALLGCSGLGCSGTDGANGADDREPLHEAALEAPSRQAEALATGSATEANNEGEAIRFRVRLDTTPCAEGDPACGGFFLLPEGSTEEIYVQGASFTEQNAVGLSRGLLAFLTKTRGKGVVIGTFCRGRLDRLPRVEGGVVIGTLLGVVIGTKRVIFDGFGRVIGTLTTDPAGKDQTIRIRAFLDEGETE